MRFPGPVNRDSADAPRRLWSNVRLGVMSALLGFLSVMPLIPQDRYQLHDSAAYIFIADGMLAGRIPWVQLWENKGLPLYCIDIVGRVLTPGSYYGIWYLETLFMALAFAAVLVVLRRTVSAGASALACTALLLGIVITCVGGNTPELWVMPLQGSVLLAAWMLISDKWRGHALYFAFVGALAGTAGLMKLNLVGAWIAIFLLILALAVRKRMSWADSIKVLGPMAIGFFAACAAWMVPVFMWGATAAWWDQTIGFGLDFSSPGIAGERPAAIWTGVDRVAFIMLPLALGALYAVSDWLARKRSSAAPAPRRWFGAFLAVWLVIEIVASSASGRSYPHYTMIWLIPAAVLMSVLWEWNRRETWVLAVPAIALCLGVVHVLPVFDSKLDWNPGFPPLVKSDSPYYRSAQERMVVEVKKRTKPSDLIFVWGRDPEVYNETGRLSAGPYGHPVTPMLMPGYQSKQRFAAFMDEFKRRPPKLIMDSSYIRVGMPSLWDLRTQEASVTPAGVIQPYMRALPDFIARHYRKVLVARPAVVYYQLKD